jgi:hypothetical protein
MDTKILSGKDVSITTYQALESRIKALKSQSVVPGLAVLLVGEDAGSQIYVRNKTKKFADLGLHSNTFQYSSSISQEDLLLKIRELNKDDRFHGILVQLPLPKHIDEYKVLRAMDPKKDVDGFHPFNLGLLAAGKPYFIPCTPKGIMRILAYYQIDLSGKHVVVVVVVYIWTCCVVVVVVYIWTYCVVVVYVWTYCVVGYKKLHSNSGSSRTNFLGDSTPNWGQLSKPEYDREGECSYEGQDETIL